MTLAAYLVWVSGFIFSFGYKAFKKTLFPNLFLLFIIPIPTIILDEFIFYLQSGSAEVVEGMFGLLGLSFVRDGFVFQLPGVTIEVAKQCSGIRSTLALVITCVLASHIFLRGTWQRLLLILCIFPVTVIKNGIRIVTLTLLGMYVDMGFLTGGFLHKSGGFVFFIPALLLIGVIIWGLRRSEKSTFTAK